MYNRRSFLKTVGSTVLLSGMGALPLHALAKEPEIQQLTILHTNDVHSRIEPFESGKYKGFGGVAKRATLIQKVRQKQDSVLLLDAGDIFQGTPYFNFFGGELEFKLMQQLQYDAATIGNHDFDAGIDGLKKQLKHISFPLLNGNYDFKNTVLNGLIEPYKIFHKNGIKIGVLGIGIKLKGLVPEIHYKETQYLNPIEYANKYATILKQDKKCDYVICLSHLGYKYDKEEKRVSDVDLAKASRNIDLIIGGHTHTFLDQPDIQKNLDGNAVLINQVGWAGIMLGRIDVFFERNTKKHCSTCKNMLVN